MAEKYQYEEQREKDYKDLQETREYVSHDRIWWGQDDETEPSESEQVR